MNSCIYKYIYMYINKYITMYMYAMIRIDIYYLGNISTTNMFIQARRVVRPYHSVFTEPGSVAGAFLDGETW